MAPPAFVMALLASASPDGLLAAGIDSGRFFKAFMDTESLAERRGLCQQLDAAQAAPYLLIFCQGLDAIEAGKDSLAVRLMQESLRQQPDFALGCVAYGDAYAEQAQWRPALRWYGEASRLAPDRLDPRYGAGQAWLALGATEGPPAYERALEAFGAMTRIDPSSADGWSNVGMALAMLGRYEEAEASYRKALSLAPNEPQIYEALGSVAARRGDDASAEEAWRKALAIDPADAPAAVELASLYGRQGKLDDAGRILETGVQAAHVGPEAGRLRRDLGLVNLLRQQDGKATSLLEEASILRPDARTLAALGHARMLAGKTAEALGVFADAAEKDSAAVVPFLQAWRAELTPLLAAPDPAAAPGQRIVRGILTRDDGTSGAAGRDRTPALVRLLLPDWKIPEGRLGDAAPAANESGYDTPPTPVYRALATYPDTAVGIEGTIYVRVQIDAAGAVQDAKVSRGGNPALEWAALDAAKRWRFQPALRNGIPVGSEVEIPFRFSSGSR
jgi:TonB family protein